MTSLQVQSVAIPGRLQPVSFAANVGELIAIVGPNGGGKTSLLRAIAGVEQAVGDVSIGSERLTSASEARRRSLVTFLPASRDLGWPIPVRDVIGMGVSRAAEASVVSDLVDRLELQTLAERPINRLSTGERTRVLFARCLAARPALHLLDEPLSNLDPYWALRFLDLMRAETERGAVVLASLHDLAMLPRFDRALLVADGIVQLNETPATLLDSERFEEVFRVRQNGRDWEISR